MAYSDIKDPSVYFQTAIYNGSNSLQAITNDGNSDLKPDFLWIKRRSDAENHMLVDSTRGVSKYLLSDSNIIEQTVTSRVETFDTDGFTVNGSSNPVNVLGATYVGWQWKANGGTTSTNTDGDINSTVQVNSDAGFSIVTDSPTNTTARSIGHGLGVAPQVIIRRARTRVESWRVFHSAAGSTGGLTLNSTAAYNSSTTLFTGVTSTTFGVGTDFSVNGNYNYVSYCFAEKQGYSKFGSYVGNGSSNGPNIYTGFKPAFVMTKAASSASSWSMYDHKRLGYNAIDVWLRANGDDAESTSAIPGVDIDLLSNGFKLKNANGTLNGSGITYIYMAFAENPFVAGGIPTTAR